MRVFLLWAVIMTIVAFSRTWGHTTESEANAVAIAVTVCLAVATLVALARWRRNR